MVNGIFTKGEKSRGIKRMVKELQCLEYHNLIIKSGDINSPSKTFNANPYDTTSSLGQVIQHLQQY